MEEVISLYTEEGDPDPRRPYICFDETSKQLVAETRTPLPPRSGQAPPAGVEVNETEVLILCALAYGPEWTAEVEHAQSAGIHIQRVKFHLTELHKRHFVHHGGGGYVPGNWTLGHEGRRFLIENNLIG